MNKLLKYFSIITIIINFLFLTGCTTLGKKFEKEKQQQGKATIYIYREYRVIGYLFMYSIYADFKDNQQVKLVPKLANGSYLPIISEPGEIVLYPKNLNLIFNEFEYNKAITLTVKSGETYYVHGFLEDHKDDAFYLKIVPHSIAERQIKNCKLILK